MKAVISGVLCALLIWIQMPTAQAVGTSASSAILMEKESGRVLYEQNSAQPRLIASTTKLMTALVALESGCSLQEYVTVPKEAVGVEGSSIYLREGERLTLEELLYGLLLHSGNDAAMAVAIHCGGSVEQFVSAMNEKAGQLGMEHSHFENPSGLDGTEHYASAYDMALLARACLENEELAAILATKTILMGERTLTNHNKLLWRYQGCIGLKTGYTEKAGRTLVSAAKRDGMTLIAVTLNAPDDWNDHAALFDWGFSNYQLVQVTGKGSTIGRLPVSGALQPFVTAAAGEDFCYPVCRRDGMSLSFRWISHPLTAPVAQGSKAGELNVFCNGHQVGSVPLVVRYGAARAVVEDKGILQRIGSLIS